jgi:diketogulonate reductase-like aldo/keto reductase
MAEVPTVAVADGVRMPMLGLGTAGLRGDDGYAALCQALDLGYRHLDTATAYHNEAQVGRALRAVDRADVFITTKLPPERADEPAAVLEESLRALGVDHIDLWLIHWPPNGTASVPTWRALIAARETGRVRAIGVSNYSIDQLDELTAATGTTPAVNQIPWSPSRHDPALLAAHRARGVAVEGYSPLSRTDLHDPVLRDIAGAHDATPAEVVLSWHLAHGIIAIPKSAHADRLRSNLRAAELSLTPGELKAIDDLSA